MHHQQQHLENPTAAFAEPVRANEPRRAFGTCESATSYVDLEVDTAWASWLTVDDGRTLEEVRRGKGIEPEDEEQDASKENLLAIENQMSLFMKIDAANNGSTNQNEYQSRTTPPMTIGQRKTVESLMNPLADKTSQSNTAKYRDIKNKTATRSLSKETSLGDTTNTTSSSLPSGSFLTARSRKYRQSYSPLSSNSSPSGSGSARLSRKNRKDRHSFGDKIKYALGVKHSNEKEQKTSQLQLGEKTTKLLQAVESLNRSKEASPH